MALTKVGKEGITGISNSSNANAITIDSSENVMIGTTDTVPSNNGASGDAGVAISPDGVFRAARSGNVSLDINRMDSDGDIAAFRKDGTTVGSIGSSSTSGNVFITGGNIGITFTSSGRGHPTNSSGVGLDNSMDWGQAEFRFDDIHATNGTIQTSDQNEKQQIASLTTAEITAAKAISKLFKTFKWNNKVVAKGDAARRHTGVIAQEVQTAMTDAGLDAADYAFWCSDTWTNDDGTSQTRLGVRYPELLAFVGAATEQRLADIETRLTALES